jgi:hypothetical protein
MTNIEENKLIESIVKWAFREGWKERARMQGVNKKAIDRIYFERIRIIIENKHYEKAIIKE